MSEMDLNLLREVRRQRRWYENAIRQINFFCPFLAERVDMAAIILSRVNREQINSAEGNLIELPFLPEKKEWLSEFVVEMLMLDG